MWNYEDIDAVNIEISSLCNSICAWCPRYENMSSVVNKQLTPQYIPVDKFKEWFPPEFVSRIKQWTYSGNYGDAGTNPDLVEIFKYTFKHNAETSVQLHTNGGMKTPSFWSELGELFSEREQRTVFFSIDGLEDTNHIYRRTVNWQKVMDNSDAYISNGGNAVWEFLTFKHNQHQIDQAKALAKSKGFSDINIKRPAGFEKGNMLIKDKDFNLLYEIEPVDESHISNGYPDLKGRKAEDLDYPSIASTVENHHSQEEGSIHCFSTRNGFEIHVTASGAVYPCCHFGHVSLYPREIQQIHKAQINHQFKDKKINLHHQSLKDILDADPYNWVYNSWEKKSCLTCWGNCGISKNKQSTMQRIYQKEGHIYGRS